MYIYTYIYVYAVMLPEKKIEILSTFWAELFKSNILHESSIQTTMKHCILWFANSSVCFANDYKLKMSNS